MGLIVLGTFVVAQLAVGGVPVAIALLGAAAGAPVRDAFAPYFRRWWLLSAVPGAVGAGGVVIAFRSADQWGLLALAAFAVGALATWQFLGAGLLQAEGEVRHVNALRIVGAVLYAGGAGIVFAVDRTTSAYVVLFVYAAAGWITLVDSWRRLRKPTGDTAVCVPKESVRRVSRSSYVTGVNALSSGLDQIVVWLILGTTWLGLYAVAVSMTNLSAIALRNLGAMLLPRLSAATPERARAITRTWLLGALIIDVAIVAVIEALVDPLVRYAFGSQFVPAITCARIAAIAWGALAYRLVLVSVLQAAGRERHASVIEAAATVVMVVAVAFGVHWFGLVGAAAGLGVGATLCCGLLGAEVVRLRRSQEMDLDLAS